MKDFNLAEIYGDVLTEVRKKDSYYVFSFGEDDSLSFMLSENQLNDSELDKIINEDDRIHGNLKNLAGKYEVNENGEVVSVILNSNPYLMMEHYWGQTFFDDGSKDLIDLGIISSQVNLNDNSLGTFLKDILTDVENGEYE